MKTSLERPVHLPLRIALKHPKLIIQRISIAYQAAIIRAKYLKVYQDMDAEIEAREKGTV